MGAFEVNLGEIIMYLIPKFFIKLTSTNISRGNIN